MNKLAQYISDVGLQKKAFAGRLGISPQHLRNLTDRDVKPSVTLAKLIEHETGGRVTVGDMRDG